MIEIRTSSEAAGVPGCLFIVTMFDRNVRYFTAYIDDAPVGQMAILKRGQFWWIDHLYVDPEFRGRGVVPSLIKVVLPAAAELTDHVWEECKGVTPEDLERNSKRYQLKMDVLRTYLTDDGRPVTMIRRHVAPLRQKAA